MTGVGFRALQVRPQLWLAALALLLGACAGTPQTDRLMARHAGDAQPAGLPATSEIADVPFFAQDEYYCGPAALAMVLAWGGVETDQDKVAERIYTPGKQGTLRSDVLGGARRYGRLAVTINNLEDLLREVAAGHPVIVFQNLGLDIYQQWHFAVVIGYDLNAGQMVLHSGENERKVTSLVAFENTWRRGDFWALVVMPPDNLPATAEAPDVLTAAAGIERVGLHDAALTAYNTMLTRWPGNAAAQIGRGNVFYARGELAQSEEAFRRATESDPGSGAAWNNLAVVLNEMGRQDDARKAALKAIATESGPVEEYRRTLADIDAART